MKTPNFISLAATCSTILLLIGCESQEQPADRYFKQSRRAAESMREKKLPSAKKMVPEKPLVRPAVRLDEWTSYSNLMNQKIADNAAQITLIKAKPDKSQKWIKKVLVLEEDNLEMRKKLDDYHALVQLNWEIFKSEMNQDLLNISSKLSELNNAEK